MKYLTAITIAVSCLLFSMFTAYADTAMFPKQDYPATATINYLNHAPSMVVDCVIMFDCGTGTPFLHSKEQDFFHRTDGSVEVVHDVTTHGTIAWVATESQYDSESNAAAALQDLIDTTTHSKSMLFHKVSTPSTNTSNTIKLKFWSASSSVTVIAIQKGSTEVEIGASYPNRDRVLALKFLNKQLQDALIQLPTS